MHIRALPQTRLRQRPSCLFLAVLLLSLASLGCRSEDPVAPPQPAFDGPQQPRTSTKAASISFCPPLTSAQNLGPVPTGISAEQTISPGAAHLFELDLGAHEYLFIEVDQLGVDVFVALLNDQGTELLSSDNLTGDRGKEHLPWWSETDLQGRLLICAPERGDSGAYTLHRTPPRPADARDHARIAAARAYHEGHRLVGHGVRATARQATTLFEEALELWQESDDPLGMMHSLYQLGRLAQADAGNRARALEYFGRALNLLGEEQGGQLEAVILYEMGRIQQAEGELHQAVDFFSRALPLLKASGAQALAAATSNELGFLYTRSGAAARALPHYVEALELWRDLGREAEEAQVLHNLGKGYYHLGDQKQALHHLELALELRQRLDLPREQASTLTALGGVFTKSKDYPQAIEALRQALRLRSLDPDRSGRATTLISLGVAYRRSGRTREAFDAYEQALPILRQNGDLAQEALVLNDLGWLHESLDQTEDAVRYFRQALPLFEEAGDPRWEAMAHCGLAFAERRRGRLLVAKAHIEKALERAEILRLLPARARLQHSVFASMQSFYSFHIDLLMELDAKHPQSGYAAQAFTASEHARARALLDSLARSDGGSPFLATPALRRREVHLQRAIQETGALRRHLLEEAPHSPEHLAAEKALRELFAEYDALHEQIRQENPRYVSFPSQVPPPETIQRQLLDADTLLLEYKLGRERSFLWAITASSVHSFELPPMSEIEVAARRVYRLLHSGGRRQVKTEIELSRLSELLLAPVAELLTARRLLIVSDGALAYIPFAVLPHPDAHDSADQTPPLLLSHEIINLPSASVATVLRQKRLGRKPPPGTVAVLADPVFQPEDPRVDTSPTGPAPPASNDERRTNLRSSPPGVERTFERLIYSGQEARAVLDQVPEEHRFLALGFDASRKTALSADLGRYRILHFATHGDLDTEHPELSRLVLSLVDERGRPQEGFLYAHEIYELNLPADLVVLSACQTALGKEIRGEGLVGLTQGFMDAGASRVLVSLWNIDDRATAQLMVHFYHRLLNEGLSPAAALRSAQLEIRRQEGWRAPFFWAGFILQGEWQ